MTHRAKREAALDDTKRTAAPLAHASGYVNRGSRFEFSDQSKVFRRVRMLSFLMVLMTLFAFFLIVLVLIQRGKGGGLAGAFGGMGGHSAFGTKAASRVTWVTYSLAACWILVCMLTIKWVSASADPTAGFGAKAAANQPAHPAQESIPNPDKPVVPDDKSGTPGGAESTSSGAGGETTSGKPSNPPGEVTEKDFDKTKPEDK